MLNLSDYTTICTIRHAKTTYSDQRRYAGTIDIPLSKTGIADVRKAAKKLVGRHFDIVITSSLRRSITTAKLLLGDETKLTQYSCCNERNYGKMQGLTIEEVKSTFDVKFINVGNDYHSLNPPEGESFELLRKRAEGLFCLIFNMYRGLRVLVISHGVFLQQFHGLLRGSDWKQSLAENVKNLELNEFLFLGDHLMDYSSSSLINDNEECW